jgi:hypothetical protein
MATADNAPGYAERFWNNTFGNEIRRDATD